MVVTIRYRHVMSHARGDKQPDVIVGLSCDTHMEPVGSNGKVERLVLDRWYAAARMKTHSGNLHSREAESTTVSEWWRWLEAVATVRGSVLIVSLGALDHWALLCFWEGVENGRIRIDVTVNRHESIADSGTGQISSQGRSDSGSGRKAVGGDRRATTASVLVTEDTPTIAYFHIKQCRSLIRWVDVRNYGISSDKLPSCGAPLSQELVRFTYSMAAELTSRSLGGVKDTSAAQALYSFRRKHLKHSLMCHTVKGVLDLENAAYYSGRCECSRIGRIDGPIYELDLRGSYLWVMRHCRLPCRLRNYRLQTATGECSEIGSGRGLIADVTLYTGTPDYPYRKEGIVVWPIGTFRTTLCGLELYHALERSRVLKWHAWAEYDMEPALAEYADEVYNIRLQAESANDRAIASWAKSLAVSLVGKFGQRGRYWQWMPDMKPAYWYDQYHMRDRDGVVRRYQEIAGKHRREVLADWSYDSVPSIAAWVTSAARIRLNQCIQCAVVPEVYYVDTDSLFTSQLGFDRLCKAGWINQGELGYLQVKGVHEWLETRGIKNYQTPEISRTAGIPGSGTSAVLSAEGLRQSVYLSTYLTQGLRPNSLRSVTHRLPLNTYRHGTIMANGKVSPLRVWDL